MALPLALAVAALAADPGSELSLNGTWDCGLDHAYSRTVVVPGLAGDPAQLTPGTLWFRRVVELPAGPWSTAVLHLRGVRGAPAVWVRGAPAPMAPEGPDAWRCVLPPAEAVPGSIVVVEISLTPQAPPAGASVADISSDLWDDVYLHFSGAGRLESLTPSANWAGRSLALRWTCAGGARDATVAAQVWDGGRLVAESPSVPASAGAALIAVPPGCIPWSPSDPRIYRLRVTLRLGDRPLDAIELPWAWRDLRRAGDHFELNGRRIGLRGMQVDWHAWVRDPESAKLAFDPDWFERKVIEPLRRDGANFLLFTGGRPPHAWQELCDRDGMVAQVGASPGVVDRFGAIFLDGEGIPSESPVVRAEVIRYLGAQQGSVQRLDFQAELCAHVAEAARLRDAPAIAPFCILSSPEGAYHGFIGNLADGRRKPAWKALAAADAPQCALLDFWDTDLAPAAVIRVPVVFLNDEPEAASLSADLTVRTSDGVLAGQTSVQANVPACGRTTVIASLALPNSAGGWTLSSTLQLPPDREPADPVVSSRPLRTVAPELPRALKGCTVGVPADEPELRGLLAKHRLKIVEPEDPHAAIVLLGRRSWIRAVEEGPAAMAAWHRVLAAGRSIVWLDIGIPDADPTEPLRVALPDGVTATLRPTGEAESFIHPAAGGQEMWFKLPGDAGWRWNGLPEGRIVPAQSLEVTGLTRSAIFRRWTARGAQGNEIRRGPYFAYELQGLYAYSAEPDDSGAETDLRARLRALAHDKPVLNSILNFNAPVSQTDLTAAYREASRLGAWSIVPLVVAGPDLERTPVEEIGYGAGKGVLVLSQLITEGRLAPQRAGTTRSTRYDPAAEQMVLNLLGIALDAYTPLAP